jgi:hypothetical protein
MIHVLYTTKNFLCGCVCELIGHRRNTNRMDLCPSYYEAGFVRGLISGSFTTMLILMLYRQCMRNCI